MFLAFFIGFAIFNFRPKTLFLGDSGALSIATIISLYFYYSFFNNQYSNLLFLSPLLFIVLDCAYVLIIRIYKKENLLSRNYLHIYQKYEIKFKNKTYLLPYLTNNTLICFIIYFYQKNFLLLYQTLISILVVTIISYFIFYFYLHKNNEY